MRDGIAPVGWIARSGERRNLEERAIHTALVEQTERWRERGDWVKLKCGNYNKVTKKCGGQAS